MVSWIGMRKGHQLWDDTYSFIDSRVEIFSNYGIAIIQRQERGRTERETFLKGKKERDKMNGKHKLTK